MSSIQQLLDDINLRYRNTFQTSQILVWFNEEQRELFDVLEIDSAPYSFQTVIGENYYPFPVDFDVTKIKVVTLQINDLIPTPTYQEIPMLRNDDNQYSIDQPFYTIISDAMYLNVPGGAVNNRNVYIYCDADPSEVTSANLTSAPDLPTRYHELLKLGVLKRIAAARKDSAMQNNFDMSYQEKLADVLWQRRLKEPEWIQPIDMMPKPNWGAYHG